MDFVRRAPLTPIQQQIWLDHVIRGISCRYTMVIGVHITGVVDEHRMRQACHQLVERHDTFRLRIDAAQNPPCLYMGDPVRARWSLLDFTSMGPEMQADEERKLIDTECRHAFDPEISLAPRFCLSKTDKDQWTLLLTYNHLISDGLTNNLLWRDLLRIYDNLGGQQKTGLKVLKADYLEYAWRVAGEVSSDANQARLHQRARQLARVQPLQMLPDNPLGDLNDSFGIRHRFSIDASLARDIEQLAKSAGASTFECWIVLYAGFLARYQCGTAVVLNSPIGIRPHHKFRSVAGCFIHNALFDFDFGQPAAFSDALERHLVAIRSVSHGTQLPLNQLLTSMEDLGVDASLYGRYLFQMTGFRSLSLEGADTSWRAFGPRTALSSVELGFELLRDKAGYEGVFHAASNLYELPYLHYLGDAFEVFLQGIVRDPSKPLLAQEVVPGAFKQLMLSKWNDTTVTREVETCHTLIDSQTEQNKDSIAYKMGHQSITYGALRLQAEWIGAELHACGAKPGDRVGVFLPRGFALAASIYAVMRCGMVFVPVSLQQPDERVAWLMHDADVCLCIVDESARDRLADTGLNLLCLPGQVPQADRLSKAADVDGSDPCYIIYTSGSTGQPKGVVVSHRGFCNHNLNTIETVGMHKRDVRLHRASIDFDVGPVEILTSLMIGSQVVMWDDNLDLSTDRLLEYCDQQGVTIASISTAMWHELVGRIEKGKRLPASIRVVLLGTEAASIEYLKRWSKCVSSNVLWVNCYGPTEASITSTTYIPDFTSDAFKRLKTVPIGRPIRNARVYILDEHRRPVPMRALGELYIAGMGLANGYWRAPEKTSGAFLTGPFEELGEERLYRTGDLARYDYDGQIEFHGRVDRQTKLRGYRVELGEIEHAILSNPDVNRAVVLVDQPGTPEARLIAFVECREGRTLEVSALHEFLAVKLPHYMRPAIIQACNPLPTLVNQKPDLRAMRSMLKGASKTTGMDTLDPLQMRVLRYCREAMGLADLAIEDNLAALGANSLTLMRLNNFLNDETGVSLSFRELFSTASIADLTALVKRRM